MNYFTLLLIIKSYYIIFDVSDKLAHHIYRDNGFKPSGFSSA
uniref:Uncharacterized protein n=1 Tax=Yersinia enterocolitica W22703 TaxID=913028 RepID=F4N069_YEREN|nr:unknown protein [Yersinia enterocolitica W22703]